MSECCLFFCMLIMHYLDWYSYTLFHRRDKTEWLMSWQRVARQVISAQIATRIHMALVAIAQNTLSLHFLYTRHLSYRIAVRSAPAIAMLYRQTQLAISMQNTNQQLTTLKAPLVRMSSQVLRLVVDTSQPLQVPSALPHTTDRIWLAESLRVSLNQRDKCLMGCEQIQP